MHYLKYYKTDHKTHYILGTNFYMFRHEGAKTCRSWHLIWSVFYFYFNWCIL